MIEAETEALREQIARKIYQSRTRIDAETTDGHFLIYSKQPSGLGHLQIQVFMSYRDADAILPLLTPHSRSDANSVYPKDVCIDCEGRCVYPSGAQCKSCGGLGFVNRGDGIPATPPEASSVREALEKCEQGATIYDVLANYRAVRRAALQQPVQETKL